MQNDNKDVSPTLKQYTPNDVVANHLSNKEYHLGLATYSGTSNQLTSVLSDMLKGIDGLNMDYDLTTDYVNKLYLQT